MNPDTISATNERNAFHLLSDAGSEMRQTLDRLRDLRDRLVGAHPEAIPAGNPASPEGLFGAVSDAAIGFLGCVSDMNLMLSQIERKLP
jgi:hypothetical protein